MGKIRKNPIREALTAKLNKLLKDYPEQDFIGQLDLVAGLAGYDTVSEMTEQALVIALDNYFDQAEINDLFIDVTEYDTEEDEQY